MHKEAGTPPGQATPRDPAAKRWGYRASAGRGIRQRERRIVQALFIFRFTRFYDRTRASPTCLPACLPACLPCAENAAGLTLSNSRVIRRTSDYVVIHDLSMQEKRRKKKSPSVRAYLVGDGLGNSVRFSLYGLLAELTPAGGQEERHAVRILDAAATSSTAVVVPSTTFRLTTHLSAFHRDFEEEEEEEEEEEKKEEDSQERVQRRSFQPVVRTDPNRRRTTTAASSIECENDEECGELISTESEGCHGESRPDRVVLISRRILSRGLC
ncbi:hypothetical protein ALC53_00058 [Atta colombica]|uniref:Uncharacterized protein n=1 Tax=Atta colombica TaxID=520822 RepID=A0A195BXV8_9HYME|nr:hypothetical protein ALC53_00058 [Atta colombica]